MIFFGMPSKPQRRAHISAESFAPYSLFDMTVAEKDGPVRKSIVTLNCISPPELVPVTFPASRLGPFSTANEGRT
jgi:hypothetical protein